MDDDDDDNIFEFPTKSSFNSGIEFVQYHTIRFTTKYDEVETKEMKGILVSMGPFIAIMSHGAETPEFLVPSHRVVDINSTPIPEISN
jgi:hypothetical protein